MFSKTIQFLRIPAVAKQLLAMQTNSLNPVKFFSAKLDVQNYDFPKDYNKELNVFKTFVPELRPDLAKESKEFKSLWPGVRKELVDFCRPVCANDKKTVDYITRALEYNCVGGKQFRAMEVILGFKYIADKSQQTPEMMRKIYMICWAMELVTSISVIHDDMIDQSWIRRGVPCWHRLPEVDLFAVSDYLLITHFGFLVLANHCRDLPYYPELVQHIWGGVIETHTGQTMDHVHLQNPLEFTTKISRQIQVGCTARFLFYAPLSMLSLIVGHNHEAIQLICDEMGHYHQCQNDFLDVFNIDGALNKPGQDIELGKCSWLSATCIERANDEQKQIMADNYGKEDPACVESIKQLYINMNMHQVYKEFAFKKYDYIKSLIQNADCEDSMKVVLFQINDLLFHRQFQC